MATDKIVFFNLPSKEPCIAWSLNRGRLACCSTVGYPDIEPLLKPHTKPNQPSQARWPYTIPAIKFPDGTWAQDSHKIADLIEQRYPEPSVYLAPPYQASIESAVPKAFTPVMSIGLNQIPQRLLNPTSVEYWVDERTKFVGGDLAENEAKSGGEVAFSGAEPGIKEITAMQKEKPDGPFFSGKEVSYADFVWIGALYFFKRICHV